MKPQVNLLPYREIYKKQAAIRFLSACGVLSGLICVIGIGTWMFYNFQSKLKTDEIFIKLTNQNS